ncbi:hypothetical protein BCR44DRAFT_1428133 [Catenaria anguillulae PL171]|uniref:Uncharacterized protein n=1 Tax=Catenaria anguillulae PL171 TaxID=765915 RepID=A0A1Y2HWI2_9FUNG|nr:hypothetical protein BCR44DRAFT_1428133 [Catenaria anguillulae PL171]
MRPISTLSLYILLALLCISQQQHDAVSATPASGFAHSFVRAQVDATNQTKLTTFNVGQFVIDFACESAKPGFCDQASGAIRRACRRIQTQLKFKRPIKAVVAMFRPCGASQPDPKCPHSRFVGVASPTHFYPVKHKDDGLVYEYPTVLLRQTDIVPDDASVAWPQYDIMAAFNEFVDYWFQGEQWSPMGDMIDLEYVATHELLHGLGWGVSGAANNPPNNSTSLILPAHETSPRGTVPEPIKLPLDLDESKSDARFYSFIRPTIFDRFHVMSTAGWPNATRSAVPISEFISKIQTAATRLIASGAIKPMSAADAQAASARLDQTPEHKAIAANTTQVAFNPKDVYSAMESDPEARSIMAAMYKTVTTADSVRFDAGSWAPAGAQVHSLLGLPPSSTRLLMETSHDPFAKGSTLGHIQYPAELQRALKSGSGAPRISSMQIFGSEFLMISSVLPSTLESLSMQLGVRSGIGPKTVAALVATGYTPASSKEWVSRKDVAELVRAEVPLGSPLGAPLTLPDNGDPASPGSRRPEQRPSSNDARRVVSGWVAVLGVLGSMALVV